jgi:PPM family protein phosphatase
MRNNGGGKGHAPAMAEGAVPILNWDAAARSDRGRVRRRNEDAVLSKPDLRIHAVADGMGGHAAGNVASALAIATLAAEFPRPPSPRIGAPRIASRLTETFARANDEIMARSLARTAEAGMGTTLTALVTLRTEPSCVIAHIGDSRAYRLRATGDQPGLVQLTQDHTWVQQQVEAGALSPDEARVHPWSSILNRVLGMEQPGVADIIVAGAQAGDTFLLCSDGLSGMITDADIAAILVQALPLDQLAVQLIDAANGSGGRDNISVVVLRASL